jgi:cation diffusion facilitator family transporter
LPRFRAYAAPQYSVSPPDMPLMHETIPLSTADANVPPRARGAAYSLERRAMIASLVLGIVLAAIKFVAYFLTDSAAIFSDALESIVNVVASAFALYAIVLAHAPADEQHPYGHGKVEFLSAGLEGGMILLAALVIAVRAGEQIIYGPHVQKVDWGLALVAFAMLLNGALGFYLIVHGRRNASMTLEADGKHLLGDAITSAAVLIALTIVWLKPQWRYTDPIVALMVAVYITFLGLGLIRRGAAGLMDEQDVEDDRKIRGILDAHVCSGELSTAAKDPPICSYHKLRHRHSGRYHWVDFHLVVPASWNVDQGHRVASTIEHEIEQSLGEGNATAHVEPCRDPQCSACGSTRS